MNAVTQIFALVAALVHLWAGTMESFLFHLPAVRKMFTGTTNNPPELRLWTFCQGFYNYGLGAGPIAGVILYHSGHAAAGHALVIYACVVMAVSGLILFIADRTLWRGALGQGVPPLIALVAAVFTT
ncbi:hypothetical protein Lfu02_56070 [Longispora fulva]|uniref:Putative membrane protein n=1 Tax=Longispora fulva TaxID=619741 RepID=A0A8J7GH13_9ACTN|nr:DUF1304 domain-containing protein [Longispora fulva]MBG6137410.1 putative membrane protein [Longispora fulva]GIG61235.1 hypothetical protein Lfu02_56070 [Longispora fulva]